jgi:lipopolysaccharide export LptBFGC system permease protein LptF
LEEEYVAEMHRSSTSTASIEDLHLLWGDAAERCGTKVLDTVLFRDARPARWLFTNKHSQVAKKKDGNLKLDRIHDRFLRLANVRSSPMSPIVLVFTSLLGVLLGVPLCSWFMVHEALFSVILCSSLLFSALLCSSLFVFHVSCSIVVVVVVVVVCCC